MTNGEYEELQNTAVQACKEINPDNPMAVAESIQAMYEALKVVLESGFKASERQIKLALSKADGEINKGGLTNGSSVAPRRK